MKLIWDRNYCAIHLTLLLIICASYATSSSDWRVAFGPPIINTMTWSTSGAKPWTLVNDTFQSRNIMVAKSGEICSNGNTVLNLVIQFIQPTIFSFWWKGNPQIGCDYLSFKINGSNPVRNEKKINGNQEWIQQNHHVEPGAYKFSWEYSKNMVTSYGTDDIVLEEMKNVCVGFKKLQDICKVTSLYFVRSLRIHIECPVMTG